MEDEDGGFRQIQKSTCCIKLLLLLFLRLLLLLLLLLLGHEMYQHLLCQTTVSHKSQANDALNFE